MTLPMVQPDKQRALLYSLKRKNGQSILKFYTIAEEVSKSAFTDKMENVRRVLRLEALIDVITVNVPYEVKLMCKNNPRHNILDYLAEVAFHETRLPKKSYPKKAKKCVRCDKPNHSTMSCKTYFGTPPTASCNKCFTGKHYPRNCKAQ
jgi:hypothetical protein